jgi:glycopeptide antibiotics resistance protein
VFVALAYTAMLALVLLVPADTEWHATRQNVYLAVFENLPWSQRLRDIFVNVAVFVPVGMLWDTVLGERGQSPRRRVSSVVIGGALFALVIESLQYVLAWRDSSLIDVLSDSAGAALGILLNARLRFPQPPQTLRASRDAVRP